MQRAILRTLAWRTAIARSISIWCSATTSVRPTPRSLGRRLRLRRATGVFARSDSRAIHPPARSGQTCTRAHCFRVNGTDQRRDFELCRAGELRREPDLRRSLPGLLHPAGEHPCAGSRQNFLTRIRMWTFLCGRSFTPTTCSTKSSLPSSKVRPPRRPENRE